MFKNLKLIFNKTNKDIRKRLGFTLFCLFIFIVGTTIPVPGVTSLNNIEAIIKCYICLGKIKNPCMCPLCQKMFPCRKRSGIRRR